MRIKSSKLCGIIVNLGAEGAGQRAALQTSAPHCIRCQVLRWGNEIFLLLGRLLSKHLYYTSIGSGRTNYVVSLQNHFHSFKLS